MIQEVKNLINPLEFRENIDISNVDKNVLVDMLRKMIIIRKAEEKIAEEKSNKSHMDRRHLKRFGSWNSLFQTVSVYDLCRAKVDDNQKCI